MRAEFTLTMPGIGSWNGKWSYGEGKHFIMVVTISKKKAKQLFGISDEVRWRHSWGDGWTAEVTGRLMKKGERKKQSDGFCGHDWMVGSIVENGRIGYSKEVGE